MEFLHKIEAIVILDHVGKRIFAKYYPVLNLHSGAVKPGQAANIEVGASQWATPEKQRALEESLFKKTHDGKAGQSAVGNEGDILLHGNHTVAFKVDPELTFLVVGGGDENEMVLSAVVCALYESLQQVLKITSSIDERTLLENYEILLLVVDELVDDGIILETSSASIVADVAPYIEDSSADGAKKALNTLSRYVKNSI